MQIRLELADTSDRAIERPEGIKVKLEKTTMLVMAVILHNIPEGMKKG